MQIIGDLQHLLWTSNNWWYFAPCQERKQRDACNLKDSTWPWRGFWCPEVIGSYKSNQMKEAVKDLSNGAGWFESAAHVYDAPGETWLYVRRMSGMASIHTNAACSLLHLAAHVKWLDCDACQHRHKRPHPLFEWGVLICRLLLSLDSSMRVAEIHVNLERAPSSLAVGGAHLIKCGLQRTSLCQQVVEESHQHILYSSPRLAGGDPLLCKKSHLNPFCIKYPA